jgi:hypothetical protein
MDERNYQVLFTSLCVYVPITKGDYFQFGATINKFSFGV